MPVSLPVQVRGHDPNGSPWEEMTQTVDFSTGGARFKLKKTVRVGQVLSISSPIPKRYRRFALADSSYKPYVLVRDVFPSWPANVVGVMFLGKDPPKGYEQKPGELYRLSTDPEPAQKERRQYTRLEVFLNLKLKRGEGSSAQEEITVTDNLSRGGACVKTAMGVTRGEILIVEDPQGAFSTRVEVRNVYKGKDGIPRLNLHFLDGEAPRKLIDAAGIGGLA